MGLRRYTPASPLSNYVELLWLQEGALGPHPRERLLPDGSMELAIDLGEPRIRIYPALHGGVPDSFPPAVLIGAHSRSFAIDSQGEACVMGVHFRPGGAYPFFRPPAGEMHNRVTGLDALWGPAAGGLRDRLLEASSPAEKFRILERFLLRQAARPLAIHPAVAFAVERIASAGSNTPISAIRRETGLSAKRLIEVFRNHVGLSPKRFQRVRRFQDAIHRAATSALQDLPDLALSCGFHDQAHFSHEFKEFSGFTPSEYLRRKTGHINHVPLDA